MSESTKATIEILEHYHHNGVFYEIPVEVINTVEQELEEQDKEIERLSNIINELEKDFERKIQSCTIEAETTTNDFYCRLHIATLTKWLNKIKELKGSDK